VRAYVRHEERSADTVLETRIAVLHIGHECGALNLEFFMQSESEETYFALSVIAARNDMKFCISAYTVRYRATVISYLSAEC
jgi:hypothetical protein